MVAGLVVLVQDEDGLLVAYHVLLRLPPGHQCGKVAGDGGSYRVKAADPTADGNT